jgi:hypothetical protein
MLRRFGTCLVEPVSIGIIHLNPLNYTRATLDGSLDSGLADYAGCAIHETLVMFLTGMIWGSGTDTTNKASYTGTRRRRRKN